MELGRMSSPGNGPPSTSPPPSFSSPEKLAEGAKDFGLRQDDTRLDIPDKPLRVEEEEDKPKGDGERAPLLERDDVENQTVGGEWRGPRPEESLAELEIHSLLWIKRPGNEALKEAYATWQAKDVLFANRVDKKRKQSNSLMNEIYQLVGFYSVFQGVLLTAVAQSNLLLCHNWWTAFFLSLLASLVTIAGVIQKFLSVWSLENTISNEEASRKAVAVLGYCRTVLVECKTCYIFGRIFNCEPSRISRGQCRSGRGSRCLPCSSFLFCFCFRLCSWYPFVEYFAIPDSMHLSLLRNPSKGNKRFANGSKFLEESRVFAVCGEQC